MSRRNKFYNQRGYQPLARNTNVPVQQSEYYNENNQYYRGDIYENNRNNYRGNYRNFRPRSNWYNNNYYYRNNSRPPPPSPPPQVQPQNEENRNENRNQRINYGEPREQRQQQYSNNRNKPRQLQLNDFMPQALQENSILNIRRLPSDVDLETNPDLSTMSTNTRSNTRSATPVDVFTQQDPNFPTQRIGRTTTNDMTQPFHVNIDDDIRNNNSNGQEIQEQRRNEGANNRYPQQQQHTMATTSSYRRRQRRVRQQQYRDQMEMNEPLEDIDSNYDETTGDSDNGGEDNDDRDVNRQQRIQSNMNFNKGIHRKKQQKKESRRQEENNKKKKQPFYLEPNRIMRYLQDKFLPIINSRGNQAYVRATTPIYDEWIRKNYDLQLWQEYLNLGTQNKHWAKDIIKRTKKRDDTTNSQFVRKKINQITNDLARVNATISDLQIQLGTYWFQISFGTNISTAAPTSSSPSANTSRLRESADRLEKIIVQYIHQHTRHVRKMTERKIQLAKAEMEEYNALKNFEHVATPTQWSIHSILKSKMKLWNTKNKNYQIATKRVSEDLPPTCISKIDFSFKIDESTIDKDEAQKLYNDIRKLIKDYRSQAMNLYLQVAARERELLNNEIQRIIDGFPKERNNYNDNMENENEAGFIAFKHYHDLREKRFILEGEQATYFLDEQRVEGDVKEQKEENSVAPTLIRSLVEDSSLQR